jgi:hypothetical protein
VADENKLPDDEQELPADEEELLEDIELTDYEKELLADDSEESPKPADTSGSEVLTFVGGCVLLVQLAYAPCQHGRGRFGCPICFGIMERTGTA